MPPRPAAPGFAQIGVRLWLALPRFAGEEDKMGGNSPALCIKAQSAMAFHLSTPRQGLGSEAKGRSVAILGGHEAQQGGQSLCMG